MKIVLVLVLFITLFLITGIGVSFSQEITPTPLCIRYDYPDQASVFNCPTTEIPFDTPTPEDVPTSTPTFTPSPTPTEVPKCWGVVYGTEGTGLNVRDNPGGNKLGVLDEGQTITLESKKTYLGYVWYSFWWENGVTGWSHGNWIEEHGDCSKLLDITPQITRQGPHILMGDGGYAPANFSSKISVAKCLSGSFQICLQMKEANPDMWIVARLFTDGIIVDNNYDVDKVWNIIKDQIPNGYDAFELENEHTPNQEEEWPEYVQFQIKFANKLAHEKNMQYLAFAYGPGWPYEHLVKYMLPYLRWVENNPLPDGRYHGVSSHASPYTTFTRSDMPWLNTYYISGRVYWMADLLSEYDFDLYAWKGVWAITELGLSDGYSGNWDATYSCQEVADAYWTTVGVYQENGLPDVLLWWSFGKIGPWHSDHDCADNIWHY